MRPPLEDRSLVTNVASLPLGMRTEAWDVVPLWGTRATTAHMTAREQRSQHVRVRRNFLGWRMVRIAPSRSAARLTRRAPWLCVPPLRAVCLFVLYYPASAVDLAKSMDDTAWQPTHNLHF